MKLLRSWLSRCYYYVFKKRIRDAISRYYSNNVTTTNSKLVTHLTFFMSKNLFVPSFYKDMFRHVCSLYRKFPFRISYRFFVGSIRSFLFSYIPSFFSSVLSEIRKSLAKSRKCPYLFVKELIYIPVNVLVPGPSISLSPKTNFVSSKQIVRRSWQKSFKCKDFKRNNNKSTGNDCFDKYKTTALIYALKQLGYRRMRAAKESKLRNFILRYSVHIAFLFVLVSMTQSRDFRAFIIDFVYRGLLAFSKVLFQMPFALMKLSVLVLRGTFFVTFGLFSILYNEYREFSLEAKVFTWCFLVCLFYYPLRSIHRRGLIPTLKRYGRICCLRLKKTLILFYRDLTKRKKHRYEPNPPSDHYNASRPRRSVPVSKKNGLKTNLKTKTSQPSRVKKKDLVAFKRSPLYSYMKATNQIPSGYESSSVSSSENCRPYYDDDIDYDTEELRQFYGSDHSVASSTYLVRTPSPVPIYESDSTDINQMIYDYEDTD
jgi:hypothetical protein